LHRITLQALPKCKLWFLDGKNSENKTIANPTIGYGFHTIKYADGTTREFFKFKTLKDINIEILEAAMRYGVEAQSR
jgi:hypothetical protein